MLDIWSHGEKMTTEEAIREMSLLANKGWTFYFSRPDPTIGRPDFDFRFHIEKKAYQSDPFTEEVFVVSEKTFEKAIILSVEKVVSIIEIREAMKEFQKQIVQIRKETER